MDSCNGSNLAIFSAYRACPEENVESEYQANLRMVIDQVSILQNIFFCTRQSRPHVTVDT